MTSNFEPNGLLKNKMPSSAYWDDRLIQRELINGYMNDKTGLWKDNTFTVVATRDISFDNYTLKNKGRIGPLRVILHPGNAHIFETAFYTFEGKGLPVGEPIKMHMNIGKAMGSNNHTPSNQFGFNG